LKMARKVPKSDPTIVRPVCIVSNFVVAAVKGFLSLSNLLENYLQAQTMKRDHRKVVRIAEIEIVCSNNY